jgi:hypothetical protein
MASISPTEHPLLYRAIKSKAWFAQRSAAFTLRGPSESRPAPETDLSLLLSANCTKSICAAQQNTCHGEFALEAQAVLTAAAANNWQVDKDAPNHARILGLPLHGSAKQLIEDAATALAELIVATQPRPTTD